jgi:hypothetical protein
MTCWTAARSNYLDAFGSECGLHHLRCLGFLCRQESIACLDHRYIDPKTPQDLSQLTADRAAAENDQRSRQTVGLHHVMCGPVVDIGQPWDGGDGRL